MKGERESRCSQSLKKDRISENETSTRQKKDKDYTNEAKNSWKGMKIMPKR